MKITLNDLLNAKGVSEPLQGAVKALIDRLESAESGAIEQARLNGMGASREAALMAKLEAAERSDAESFAMYRKARDERDALRARVEAAERNLSCCQSEREEAAALFLSVKNRLRKERDALRARIEAMEKQEPVATVRINAINGNPSVDFVPGHHYLHHNDKLYALPGAQGEEK